MDDFDTLGNALAELTAKYGGAVDDQIISSTSDVPELTSDANDMSSGSTAPNSYSDTIMLNVGGYRYETSYATLRATSGLFHSLLSDESWRPGPDGSYFVDADPELFKHLLRFMRRPTIFPLFYDSAKGYDYDLCTKLEAEAAHFRIEALHTWLKEKRYLQAVKVKASTPRTWDISLDRAEPRQYDGNTTEEWQAVPKVNKVYLCPRRIVVHRGEPDKCGRACHEAQGNAPNEYEDVSYTDIVVVENTTEFNASVCQTNA